LRHCHRGMRSLYFIAPPSCERTGDRDEFLRVNVRGTENILKVSIDGGIRKFIHFSSVATYGMDPPDGTDETTAPSPLWKSSTATPRLLLKRRCGPLIKRLGFGGRNSDQPMYYGPYSNPWDRSPHEAVNSGQMMQSTEARASQLSIH